MKQVFNYVPKKENIFQSFFNFAAGAALIIVPIIYPFSITIKRKITILPYPYSAIVLALVGIGLILYQFTRLKKEGAIRQNPTPIVLEDGKVTFGKVKKGEVVELSFALADIESTNYDSEDEIFTVYTKEGKSFDFDSDYFETKNHFQEFISLVKA